MEEGGSASDGSTPCIMTEIRLLPKLTLTASPNAVPLFTHLSLNSSTPYTHTTDQPPAREPPKRLPS